MDPERKERYSIVSRTTNFGRRNTSVNNESSTFLGVKKSVVFLTYLLTHLFTHSLTSFTYSLTTYLDRRGFSDLKFEVFLFLTIDRRTSNDLRYGPWTS